MEKSDSLYCHFRSIYRTALWISGAGASSWLKIEQALQRRQCSRSGRASVASISCSSWSTAERNHSSSGN